MITMQEESSISPRLYNNKSNLASTSTTPQGCSSAQVIHRVIIRPRRFIEDCISHPTILIPPPWPWAKSFRLVGQRMLIPEARCYCLSERGLFLSFFLSLFLSFFFFRQIAVASPQGQDLNRRVARDEWLSDTRGRCLSRRQQRGKSAVADKGERSSGRERFSGGGGNARTHFPVVGEQEREWRRGPAAIRLPLPIFNFVARLWRIRIVV